MLLAIDAGNTNVVFALVDASGAGAGEIRARWRIATDQRRTAAICVWLHKLLGPKDLKADVTRVCDRDVFRHALHNMTVLRRNFFQRPSSLARTGCRRDRRGRAKSVGADRARTPGGAARTGRLADHRLRHRDDVRTWSILRAL